MSSPHFFIQEQIAKASTLPRDFYTSSQAWDLVREQIFANAWHWLGDSKTLLPNSNYLQPLSLLPNYLDEPLLLTRGAEEQRYCLSNVCTHRANLLLQEARPMHAVQKIRCSYHGRRFDVDGRFISMPEFEQTEKFPAPCDHLPRLPLYSDPLGCLWASLSQEPLYPIADVWAWILQRIDFLPLSRAQLAPDSVQNYSVRAHWALYCDNYLEGFHIPYVHPALNNSLDYSQYATHLHPNASLQIGYADENAEESSYFKLPAGHIDAGKRIAAYYFWLFPNVMINVYTWGVSLNIVQPQSPSLTNVHFCSYVWDEKLRQIGAGGDLHQVEMEDEKIVEAAQKGINSRLYTQGRFSPTQERGVHHFHRLLAQYIG